MGIEGNETLLVSELFYSLQGESTRAGLPCLFIRLAGCNLRCRYCDASYTWEEAGTITPLADILAFAGQYPGVMIEITGGEPLLQPSVYVLMQALVDRQRMILLETNGSLALDRVPGQVTIIMDVKCPDSGMADRHLPSNFEMIRQRSRRHCQDEIKFVLSSSADFDWASKVVEQERLAEYVAVLFSPVTAKLPPPQLAELILRHQLPVRLQLQLHTLLWPGQSRGV